jgi:hypothetical protein
MHSGRVVEFYKLTPHASTKAHRLDDELSIAYTCTYNYHLRHLKAVDPVLSMSVPPPALKAAAGAASSTCESRSCPHVSNLTVIAQTTSTPTDALYNFRLLSALRSDDVSEVQPFLEGLQGGTQADREIRTGQLLGMAIRIASGTRRHEDRADRQRRSFNMCWLRPLSRIRMCSCHLAPE